MKEELLKRSDFEMSVFYRDRCKCVFCGQKATAAHHILDRKLFSDGGYYLNNGVSVCDEHHWLCEIGELSVEEVRAAANIIIRILPIELFPDRIYDKWGNQKLDDIFFLKGPLFYDSGCQKALKMNLWRFIDS